MKLEWDGQHWRDESGMQVPDPGYPAWVVVSFFAGLFVVLVGFSVLVQAISS